MRCWFTNNQFERQFPTVQGHVYIHCTSGEGWSSQIHVINYNYKTVYIHSYHLVVQASNESWAFSTPVSLAPYVEAVWTPPINSAPSEIDGKDYMMESLWLACGIHGIKVIEIYCVSLMCPFNTRMTGLDYILKQTPVKWSHNDSKDCSICNTAITALSKFLKTHNLQSKECRISSYRMQLCQSIYSCHQQIQQTCINPSVPPL